MVAIAIATPVRPSDNSGNNVTAARWADFLRDLGHDVTVLSVIEDTIDFGHATQISLDASDLLIVLHARRGAFVAQWWTQRHPDRPLVVALTGTDLYRDMPADRDAMTSVRDADALIVLQKAAVERLAGFDPTWAGKTHVIHQSVTGLPERTQQADEFRVVVLAHLREVKDPLMCARALRHLPATSVVVHHAGAAMDEAWREAATAEATTNPRYMWLGELTGPAALDLLATATVLACTSVSEGGANVVTEAIAMGVPVIGTRIDGNTGLLGEDYPGLVPVGDDVALAQLLTALETDSDLLDELQRRIDELVLITEPATERSALATLLGSLGIASD